MAELAAAAGVFHPGTTGQRFEDLAAMLEDAGAIVRAGDCCISAITTEDATDTVRTLAFFPVRWDGLSYPPETWAELASQPMVQDPEGKTIEQMAAEVASVFVPCIEAIKSGEDPWHVGYLAGLGEIGNRA